MGSRARLGVAVAISRIFATVGRTYFEVIFNITGLYGSCRHFAVAHTQWQTSEQFVGSRARLCVAVAIARMFATV